MLFPLVATFLLLQGAGQTLPPWAPGVLEIHQIQTGRGNCTYFIFPDGTTALLDAGAVPNRAGQQLALARPNSTRSPAEWISRYIAHVRPHLPATLDYAIVTHYHDDHMGAIEALARLVPIRTLIDRGGTAPYQRNFSKESLVFAPGRNDQIVAGTPGFEVRNIAGDGRVWTGDGVGAESVFPGGWASLPPDERPTENERSLAIRIRYGRFTYYSGGDLPGVVLDGLPAWHDLETPVAQVVGPVDVCVLNHHGWLDTTNPYFLQQLQPRVVIIPAWHATHPDHGVIRRLLAKRSYAGPRDIYITSLLDAPRAVLSYLGRPFRSTEGHVVVRVEPGGMAYRVFVLDDSQEGTWPVLSVSESIPARTIEVRIKP